MIYSHKAKLIKKQNKNYLRTMNKDLRIRELFAYAPANVNVALHEDPETPPKLFVATNEKLNIAKLSFNVIKLHLFIIIPTQGGKLVIPFCPYGNNSDVTIFHMLSAKSFVLKTNKHAFLVKLNQEQLEKLKKYLDVLYYNAKPKEAYSPGCFYCNVLAKTTLAKEVVQE